jgi:6,7-dimethyl-8-ribityllumazine synthase
MAGLGAPDFEPVKGAARLRVAVVAGRWHGDITEGLLAGAQRALADSEVDTVTELRVPGCFELPVAAARLAAGGFDAIVALGVVIRGGTPHFEYVCQGVTDGLTRVAVDTGVPIGFGVLTCDDEEQARARSGLPGSSEDKGHDAAVAAISAAVTLLSFPHPR